MLSIAHISSGHSSYYLDLAREDYYLDGGEPPGRWWGRAAESFELRGTVTRDQLRSLLRGESPAGEPLVQNAGKNNRRAGFDLTFSAPKSVSVFWSVADRDLRREIQQAHDAAVKAALTYLEQTAAYSRRGQGGKELVKATLAVALFEHGTSRALDALLHTHALVMNVSRGIDRQTATLEAGRLYRHKMAAGAVYRQELAYQLVNRLGLKLEATRVAFEIRGVPKSLIEAQSQRRAEVERLLTVRGVETASAAAQAALETREVKDVVPPRGELFERWTNLAKEHGFTARDVRMLVRPSPEPVSNLTVARELAAAKRDLSSSVSHFSERELIRRTSDRLLKTPVESARLVRYVQFALTNDRHFPLAREHDGYQHYTTPTTLAAEQKMLRAARHLALSNCHNISPRTVEKAISRAEMLSDEQKATVRYLTSRRGGALRLVQGLAGTGKTTMLKTACEAWQKAGYKVCGVAVAGKAAKELHKGAGIPTETFAMLDLLLDKDFGGRLLHHTKQIARAAAKMPTFKLDPFRIDERTVLIVDEASMLGTNQMSRLIEATKKRGGLLVLIGDRKQLPAIEAGGAFGALLDRIRHAVMTHIVRQKDAEDLKVVEAAAQGDMKEALRNLARRNLITVGDGPNDARSKLIAEWSKREANNPRNSLIFCSTNADAETVNHLCQQERRDAGALDSNRRVAVENKIFYQGDRVLFTKRSRVLNIENGETGTILETNSILKTILVRADDGTLRNIPLRDYPSVKLGYAVTTHKGQGTTVDRSYILLGGPMQDKELSYVQLSRARDSVRLFVNQHEAGWGLGDLIYQMSKSNEKDLATPPPEEVNRPRQTPRPTPVPQPVR